MFLMFGFIGIVMVIRCVFLGMFSFEMLLILLFWSGFYFVLVSLVVLFGVMEMVVIGCFLKLKNWYYFCYLIVVVVSGVSMSSVMSVMWFWCYYEGGFEMVGVLLVGVVLGCRGGGIVISVFICFWLGVFWVWL